MFMNKFPKALSIFNLSWIIFFFLSTFIFDFDNSMRAKKRRACDQYLDEAISFTVMKELWKPKKEDYPQKFGVYEKTFDDDYQKWNSWEKLSDTVSNKNVGKNICNYSRFKKVGNLEALFAIFGFILLLFIFT